MAKLPWKLGSQLTGVLSGEIARGAVATFVLRSANTGAVVVLSLVIARVLGAEGYGAYAFAMTCVSVLSAPALLGFDGLLLREVAVYHAESEWALLRGILRRATQATLIFSVTLALIAAGIAWDLESRLGPQMLTSVWIALLALPMLTIVRISQAAMLGLRHATTGQIPETVVLPIVFGISLAIVLLCTDERPNANLIVWLNLLAIMVAWPTSIWLLRKAAPAGLWTAGWVYRTRTWAANAWMFGLTTSFNLLNIGIGVILLGVMKGADAAGIFSIANSGAQMVALPLMAITVPLAPAAARAFAAKNQVELQRLATKSSRGALLCALPIAIAYALFGRSLLSFFGPEFGAGYAVLMVLTIGQVGNTMLGSVGALLQMTGHERAVAVGLGSSSIVNIVLCVELIPVWGMEGAAVAAAAAMIGWNVFLAIGVYRWLGIRPTALG